MTEGRTGLMFYAIGDVHNVTIHNEFMYSWIHIRTFKFLYIFKIFFGDSNFILNIYKLVRIKTKK